MKTFQIPEIGPSRRGWALLLIVLLTAVFLRFWQLGEWPPGLYRDEAFNGLDALDVLNGRHALFFTANNGREPAYIYLTALFISLMGRAVTAVRLGAAVAGSFTTLLVYRLAADWFNRRTGLLAGWLWAITLWPVHLSRIGLRPLLLVPALTAAFWLGSRAYRRRSRRLWFAAGLFYGLGFYTYLAVRFTPVLLAATALFLLWQRKGKRLWPGALWFGLGTAVSLAPLLPLAFQIPGILLGRAGQVSIFNPAINGGDFWGALTRQTGAALGMFLWRGDAILRHNPAGRPLFDLFIAGPFLIGLGWCLKQWRRPAAAVVLLWTAVMLGPTILAEDAPHFLRAVGVLPAVLLFPAIGLAQLWQWRRLPTWLRQGLVIGLALASLGATIQDYAAYGRDPDTGYLFEQGARQLAADINSQEGGTAVYVDERFWDGWPSVPFLAANPSLRRFTPSAGLPAITPPSLIIAWPYENLDFLPEALPAQALVFAASGPLARGDLEPEPYPLYAKYLVSPPRPGETTAVFGDQLALAAVELSQTSAAGLQVDLVWEPETAVSRPLTAFVHVLKNGAIIAQDDAPPGGGNWPAAWFRPGLQLQDRHTLLLPEPFDPARQSIMIGLYDSVTLQRLPVTDGQGRPAGDAWTVNNEQ